VGSICDKVAKVLAGDQASIVTLEVPVAWARHLAQRVTSRLAFVRDIAAGRYEIGLAPKVPVPQELPAYAAENPSSNYASLPLICLHHSARRKFGGVLATVHVVETDVPLHDLNVSSALQISDQLSQPHSTSPRARLRYFGANTKW